jgi:hypothetical protein
MTGAQRVRRRQPDPNLSLREAMGRSTSARKRSRPATRVPSAVPVIANSSTRTGPSTVTKLKSMALRAQMDQVTPSAAHAYGCAFSNPARAAGRSRPSPGLFSRKLRVLILASSPAQP